MLADLRVSSSFPLTQLPPAPLDATVDDTRQVVIREGEVAYQDVPNKTFTVLPDGDIYFAVANVARYRLSQGRAITVQILDESRRKDIPGFLIGSVFGALLHQRGDFPLHAGCIEFEGKAILFTGPSGAGKSTLSAALLQRGHRILGDDVIVIRKSDQGFLAAPTVARCKLWQDSLDALEIAPDRQLRQVPRQTATGLEPKFECLTQDQFCVQPLPIAAIYHLQASDFPLEPGPMSAEQALPSIWSNVYLAGLDRKLGSSGTLFQTCAQLAGAVSHRPWAVAANLEGLPANISALEQTLREYSHSGPTSD